MGETIIEVRKLCSDSKTAETLFFSLLDKVRRQIARFISPSYTDAKTLASLLTMPLSNRLLRGLLGDADKLFMSLLPMSERGQKN